MKDRVSQKLWELATSFGRIVSYDPLTSQYSQAIPSEKATCVIGDPDPSDSQRKACLETGRGL